MRARGLGLLTGRNVARCTCNVGIKTKRLLHGIHTLHEIYSDPFVLYLFFSQVERKTKPSTSNTKTCLIIRSDHRLRLFSGNT